MQPPSDDETIRLKPRTSRRQVPLYAALVAGVLVLGGLAGWWFYPRPAPPPPPVPAPVEAPPPVPPIAAAPQFPVQTASEAQIRDNVPPGLSIFRFADNPKILVLDFASLHQQGLMLNRVAALIEKSGFPHDRVVTEAELDQGIRDKGDTADTFYYGHDYSAGGLHRFFTLAEQGRVALNPEEARLRALLQQESWLSPGLTAGLISIPAIGADSMVTPAARAAILRHELSHGEFFANPAYADYVRQFWATTLSEAEREGVRRYLGQQEYDIGIEELVVNEMQAYLMFTRDPTIFRAGDVGLSTARLTELRSRFLAGMPQGWLRDLMAGYGK